MDRSRKASRKRNEATLQHQSRPEALRIEELAEEKLAQLQASINQLKKTPKGKAELQRRVKAFGDCKRLDDETSGRYYDRLRHWLERPVPQTKLPRHLPRQTGR
jgi:hypothetical protein